VDVLIIGAGPAGLAAACALRQQHGDSLSFRILEARPRIGGRVLTNNELGLPVDLGQCKGTARL
jgi:protoporphyrinogen oxidase